MMPSSRTNATELFDSWDTVWFESACARSAPVTGNLDASPTLEVCGVTKMPNDEWIKTLADSRRVKFSDDKLMDATFITAQIEGNEVVYSILVNKAETNLSRKEVEGRFHHELSKK